jgi:hexosaminidase
MKFKVDDTSISVRIWPRAFATAERLWSDIDVRSISDATSRLGEFQCHISRRGIPSSPIGPGYCDLQTYIHF